MVITFRYVAAVLQLIRLHHAAGTCLILFNPKLQAPNDPGKLAVKRIIALGGDIVHTRPPCPVSVVRVPEGHMWVEGDVKDLKNRSTVIRTGLYRLAW